MVLIRLKIITVYSCITVRTNVATALVMPAITSHTVNDGTLVIVLISAVKASILFKKFLAFICFFDFTPFSFLQLV
jgi:hypothetical protein